MKNLAGAFSSEEPGKRTNMIWVQFLEATERDWGRFETFVESLPGDCV
jgi:hypothetical protein